MVGANCDTGSNNSAGFSHDDGSVGPTDAWSGSLASHNGSLILRGAKLRNSNFNLISEDALFRSAATAPKAGSIFPEEVPKTAHVHWTAMTLSTAWKPSEPAAHNSYCCQLQHSGGSIIVPLLRSLVETGAVLNYKYGASNSASL